MNESYDFGGWATKNNIRCTDGRTIMKGAFKDCDGMKVPLVWNHQHNEPENVLGYAILQHRDEGTYAYCKFNETPSGKNAKLLVQHGDVSNLSIYANQLKQTGNESDRRVLHGMIREVSLVLAGANSGAKIDSVFVHSDEDEMIVFANEAIIYSGEGLSLSHAESEEKEGTKKMPEEEKKSVQENSGDDETVQDVIDSMNEKQKKVLYALVGAAMEQKGGNNDKEEPEMKHNVFENDTEKDDVLTHSETAAIFADVKRYGSLKDSVMAHGIEDIDILFPDAKNPNGNTPDFIQRQNEWVKVVMSGTHHTPFSRIKSIHADITEDDARALGYLPDRTHRDTKGNLVDADGNPAYKKEEVFSLLKRTTTPATIYKKQKLDRDDIIDITDFDVVSWIKGEMRLMLDEEIARAILVGDGRSSSSDDKINESNIRPIWKDADLYTVKTAVEFGTDVNKNAKAFIRAVVKSRKNYRGSGTPTCYMTEDLLTDLLLLEDLNGRVIYDTQEKLCSALRVSKIVTVPVMEGLTRVDSNSKTRTLQALIVNLSDYNVGADKGGNVSMFDDFDIDYNAQKYLIETRCSGALVKPYSAIAIESIPAATTSASSSSGT